MNKKKRKPYINLAIDLGNGMTDHIFLYKDDNIIEVSLAFCLKNNLPEEYVKIIARNLKK
jgi:hypothetical protein